VLGPPGAAVEKGKESERDWRVHIRLCVEANAVCEPAAAILPETTHDT